MSTFVYFEILLIVRVLFWHLFPFETLALKDASEFLLQVPKSSFPIQEFFASSISIRVCMTCHVQPQNDSTIERAHEGQ